jgi:oxygen-independent coproporphyrinogen-3 oxidase
MREDPGFALYVHWPFCASKCPYCDFNSHVRERVDQARWRAGLLAELAHMAALAPGRRLQSIFFGGGTPSLMEPATAAAIIDAATGHWSVDGQLEITLEANPGSVDEAKFTGFRSAGVGRLSLGVQSLRPADLAALGRRHSVEEARRAIGLAARLFDRYSFDLIYARPGQTAADWRGELQDALVLAGDHLSVYQLTIEDGTRFGTLHARGELDVPDDDAAGALYELTQEVLEAAGLPAYEVSNHARPGQESRHNLTYWRYGDYVGVGPGAHGRLTLPDGKVATVTHRAPEVWLEQVERRGTAAKPFEPIGAEQRLEELLMMGLRLTEGVALARIHQETGRPWQDWLDGTRLDRLTKGGFLVRTDDGRLRATAAGRQRLSAVLASLLG